MKSFILTLTLLAFCAPATLSKTLTLTVNCPILKGLEKGLDGHWPGYENRDSIIKDLEKSKLGFEIVDDKKPMLRFC